MRKHVLSAVALAASTVIGSAASHADFVGSVWVNQFGAASDATIAQAAGLGTPDATFTATSINFATGDSDAITVGNFLAGGGATCTGAGCGAILDNSYFLITNAPGFLATAPGGIAAVTHDDGIQLAGSIDGLIIDNPGPTGAVTDFGVFSGPQAIQLSYGEVFGGPAVLIANLGETAVPEPASLALLGTALAGFGAAISRRRRRT